MHAPYLVGVEWQGHDVVGMIVHLDVGIICHFLTFDDQVLGFIDQPEGTEYDSI